MENILLISDAAKAVQVESHVLRYWEEELQLPIRRNELGHRFYTKEDVERFKMIKNMKERGLQLKAIKMILKDGKFDILESQNDTELKCVPEQAVMEKPLQSAQSTDAAGDNPESREEKAQRLQWILQQMIGQAVRENNTELVQQVKAEMATQMNENIIQQIGAGLAGQIGTEVATRVKTGLAGQIGAEVASQIKAGLAQQMSAEIAAQVKESMLKELDYQFRMQEEREEERAKQTIERTEYYYQQMDELLRRKSRKKPINTAQVSEGINMTLLKEASGGENPKLEKPKKKKLFSF